MDYTPSQIELDEIDKQIKESKKVSSIRKKMNKNLLRVFFWLGNQLTKLGYTEEFIEGYSKKHLLQFIMSKDKWKLAHQKLEELRI